MITLFGGTRSGVFFRLCISTRFSELEFSVKSLRSNAVFRGQLKCPSPCRIRSAPGRDRVRGLSETWIHFCMLGGIRPRLRWISAYAELERKKHTRYGITFSSKLASFFIWLLISSSPHFFHVHSSKRLTYCAHRTTDCCVGDFQYRISRIDTFVRAFVIFEGGRSLPNKIITPSVRADSSS